MDTGLPSMIAGRYRVLRELGRGGMGAVYVVEHVHTGDTLAMKVLLAHVGANPELVERFKREARAPARIKSDHVVRVNDADVAPELGGAPFLVMELLQGEDLEKILKRRGRLPPPEVVMYLSQAARALDKAHSLGIVHRDLKPENLFLHTREDGSKILKIIDFGISRMTADAAGTGDGLGNIGSAGMTRSGVMLGTPYYMSPEQARGQTALSGPPTDIWSMGLIATHLLTGITYWTAQSIGDLMVQIIAAPLPPPTLRAPWLPPAFDAWFARSCERDPGRRWSSASQQIDALAQALGVTAGGTLPLGGPGSGGHNPPPSSPMLHAANPANAGSAGGSPSGAASTGSTPDVVGSSGAFGPGQHGRTAPAATPPPLAATGPNVYRTLSDVRASAPAGTSRLVIALAAVAGIATISVGGTVGYSRLRAHSGVAHPPVAEATAPSAPTAHLPASAGPATSASANTPLAPEPTTVAEPASAPPTPKAAPPSPAPKPTPRDRPAHPTPPPTPPVPTASSGGKGFNPTAP